MKGFKMIELIYLKNKRTFEADFLIAKDKLEDFKAEYGEDFAQSVRESLFLHKETSFH